LRRFLGATFERLVEDDHFLIDDLRAGARSGPIENASRPADVYLVSAYFYPYTNA
jgi:hypothetical protein